MNSNARHTVNCHKITELAVNKSVYSFSFHLEAGIRSAALSPFGTACRAQAALHDRPNKHTQTYISCNTQKALPSSVFSNRSRLDLERTNGFVRRDSMKFVRFSFTSFSSVSIGVLLFDIHPMT